MMIRSGLGAIALVLGLGSSAWAETLVVTGQFDQRTFPGSNLQNGRFQGQFAYSDTTGQLEPEFTLDLVRADGSTLYTFSPATGTLTLQEPIPGIFSLTFQGSTPKTPDLPRFQLFFADGDRLDGDSRFLSATLVDPARQARGVVRATLQDADASTASPRR